MGPSYDWSSLGSQDARTGLPMPGSPLSSAGIDPDEMREMLAQRAADRAGQEVASGSDLNNATGAAAGTRAPIDAMGTLGASRAELLGQGAGSHLAADHPINPPRPVMGAPDMHQSVLQPTQPTSAHEDHNWAADTARQAMAGQLRAGSRLEQTADQEQPDPTIASLEAKRAADQATAPDPRDPRYKPGFGTRLLRGLKGAGLGLAEHGVFGAGLGAIDPRMVGGTAYGAPTDAYDAALEKSQRAVAGDTSQLATAEADFKRAEAARQARIKAAQLGGEAYKGAGTGATSQQQAETAAAEVPIKQEQADAARDRAFSGSTQGKLNLTQAEIDDRTKRADSMRLPAGMMRTRYILTGEIQPERQATPEEIAVNRVLGSWRQSHNGQNPASVGDWQSIYAAAKGGTSATTGEGGKNLREAASIAGRRVHDLEAQMQSKGAVLWSPQELQQHKQDLDDAKAQEAALNQQLLNAGGPQQQPEATTTRKSADTPPPLPPNARGGEWSPDGRFIVEGGGWVKTTGADGLVRMRVPDPQNPGKMRYARFPPENAPKVAEMGGQFVGKGA